MSETTQPNGKTSGTQWVTTLEAMKLTSFGRRKLDKMAATGVLAREKDARGLTVWDAELLMQALDVDEDEAPASPSAVEAAALLKQAHGHLEGALKLVLEPASALLKSSMAENERLREHIRKLEATHLETQRAREELLSEQHLRQLATLEVSQNAARKDRALALVGDNVPKLLAAINPKATAVVALMRSLTDEQRGMLLETDLLSAEQKDQVRAVLADAPPVAPPEKGPTDAPGQ